MAATAHAHLRSTRETRLARGAPLARLRSLGALRQACGASQFVAGQRGPGRARNLRVEDQNSKEARNPKPESRTAHRPNPPAAGGPAVRSRGRAVSGLGLQIAFGLRTSEFGLGGRATWQDTEMRPSLTRVEFHVDATGVPRLKHRPAMMAGSAAPLTDHGARRAPDARAGSGSTRTPLSRLTTPGFSARRSVRFMRRGRTACQGRSETVPAR